MRRTTLFVTFLLIAHQLLSQDVTDSLWRDVRSKRVRGALHDIPLVERIIPGVTFQILNPSSLLLDVHVGAAYRLSTRFSAGIGWVQRFYFNRNQSQQRIFGPRATFKFNLYRGFSIRSETDVVNAVVGQPIRKKRGGPRDNFNTRWEWSTLIGVRKDFHIYKNMYGNLEGLFNLNSPLNSSPYKDLWVIRFGLEFSLKKR